MQFQVQTDRFISNSPRIFRLISTALKTFPTRFILNRLNTTQNQNIKSTIKIFADYMKKLLHLLKRCSIFPSIQLCRYSSVVALSKIDTLYQFCLQALWNILAKKGSVSNRSELRCQRHTVGWARLKKIIMPL